MRAVGRTRPRSCARYAATCSSSSSACPRRSSAQSLHALTVDASGNAIGCARLLADGHIGRVAVLAPWRRCGVGSALVSRLIDEARGRGDARVILNAQIAAMPFYARHGFVASGDVFDEAGIAHRVMERPL
jgi:predicted GNAT family N-acyltransferase